MSIKIASASALVLATAALVYPYARQGTLYSVHPIAMGIFAASSIGAVVAMQRPSSADRTLAARKSALELHASLQLLALASGAIGFWAIYTNKNNNNKPHLTSVHGMWGAITFTASLLAGVFGMLVKRGVLPKANAGPKHRNFGLVALFSIVSVAGIGLLFYHKDKLAGKLILAGFVGAALFGVYNTATGQHASAKKAAN